MTLTDRESIDRMFEEQVKQRPGHTAAADINKGRLISYKALKQQSGQWVGRLKDAGTKAGDIAALHLNSPIDTAAAVLAVLKMGATCLPLHPSDPTRYTHNILRYSKAHVLLIDEPHKNTFAFEGKILLNRNNDSPAYDDIDDQKADMIKRSECPSFLIYSSQGTGRPEGLLLSGKKITNWLTFNCETLGIDFSHTLFVSEPFIDTAFPLWLANLVTGGTVYFYRPCDDEWFDISRLTAPDRQEKFSSIACSLSFLGRLVSHNAYSQQLAANIVNIVTIGEESFDAGEFKQFIKENKIKWHNYYGFPRMNMITTLAPDPAPGTGGFRHRHIGRPGMDTRAYVLDPGGGIVTVGITGELYVSGDGVMTQFHRNEPLNRSLFVKNARVTDRKIHKTGDKASWQADGRLSFSGRTDNRVTLNSRPFALEEIEAALFQHPVVEACAVVLKDTMDEGTSFLPMLYVYIVLNEDTPVEHLQEHLKMNLPPEPLPFLRFIKLVHLPRRTDGTIDREYLQRLDFMDNRSLRELEETLRKEPGIDRAAILAGEKIEPPSPLHTRDFLPRAAAGISSTAAVLTGGADTGDKDSLDPFAEGETTPGTPGKEKDDRSPPALIEGKPIKSEEGDPQILSDALKRAAAHHGNNGILYIHSDGSEHFQGYKDLMKEAQQVLAGLKHMKLNAGDKVIFQFNRDEDYTAAFWASQLGGMVPVPIMVPRSFNEPTNETAMLYNVWETLDRPVILTNASLEKSLARLSNHYDFDPSKVITIEALKQHGADCRWHRASPGDLALLLFTSGSTGIPKGVMQSHRTILAREKGTIRFNEFTGSDISMNWMPLEHVGGVVMFHVRDVYCCCSQVQVRTDYILSSPLRWMDIIDKHNVTITWAPNFAYGLVNEQMEQLEASGVEKHWDLSSMKFILNGGEAVNAVTVKGFLNRLAPSGLPGDAVKPAWGMSETCSGVVYSHALTREPGTGIHHIHKHSLADRVKKSTSGVDSVTFVELGRTIPGVSIRVVDPTNRVMREGQVGRLQIKGTTVTTGYYNNPALNREVFTPDGWFDTGDLGFILNGKMTITGRAKDVIIIHGINYNNVEIESIVEEVEGVEASYTAACAARDPYSDTEKMIIFYSSVYTDPGFHKKPEQIKKIERKLVEKMGIKPDLVIPVEKEEIPKTSIGKIQRLKLAQLYENGHFDDIIKQVDIALENENTLPQWFFKQSWVLRPLPYPTVDVEESMYGRCCLIFEDTAGLGEILARKWSEEAGPCIRVTAGRTFKKIDPFRYEIDFQNPGDYKRICKELTKKDNNVPMGDIEIDIFHLWNYKGESDNNAREPAPARAADIVRDAQARGVYSLLYVIQAAAGAKKVRLFVVGNHTQQVSPSDPTAFERAGIPGFLKSAALEFSWLNCRCIDLEPGPLDTNARIITRESGHAKTSEIEVAYRDGRRRVSQLARVPISRDTIGTLPIKKGGIYLVSGGLGGIGNYVSKWLMAEYDAKLIITGRTPLPPRDQWEKCLEQKSVISRRLRSYLDIERVSSEFIYGTGDAADETFLKTLTTRAEEKWGDSLSGIFHLAGYGNLEYHWTVMDDHWVTTETPQTFDDMYRSKVYGTLALHGLVKEDPQALFVGFSSTTAIFGAATFSAYAATNCFLDNFCRYRRSSGYPNTYCLNWSSWDNVGMSENNAPHMVKAMMQQGYRMITPQQGLLSLFLALGSTYPHLIIGLNGQNRNIKKHLAEYPPDQQMLHIYYSVKNEADFSVTQFQKHVSDILLKRRKYNGKPPIPLFHPLAFLPVDEDEGVIDYFQLEAMDKRVEVSSDALDMPETPTEKTLARIWQELLGKPRIHLDDNFFELGGHSLKATIMVSRIHKEMNVILSLGDIFKLPTIKNIADYIDSAVEDTYETIQPVEEKEYYPLSPIQKRFFILGAIDNVGTVLNLPEVLIIEGTPDPQRLERAFQHLMQRHESLRTSFELSKDEPVQIIHKDLRLPIAYLEAEERDLQEMITGFITPFDLGKAPLLRVKLVTFSREKHLLFIETHHIISDGTSQAILVRDFIRLHEGKELPSLRIQYNDFAAWQRSAAGKAAITRQEAYWLDQFKGELPDLNLYTDYPRPPVQSFKGEQINFFLEEELTQNIKQLMRQTGTTLYMVMLAALNILLQKYTGQEDIVIGTAAAGREVVEVENILGVFINALAMRNRPEAEKTFEGFLKEVKENTLKAYENQAYPFDDLIEKVMVKKDISRNPLYDVDLVVLNMEPPSLEAEELKWIPLDYEYKVTEMDLAFYVMEVEAKLRISLLYCTVLFKKTTIERIINYFKEIISAVVENKDIKLKDIEVSHDLQSTDSEIYKVFKEDLEF